MNRKLLLLSLAIVLSVAALAGCAGKELDLPAVKAQVAALEQDVAAAQTVAAELRGQANAIRTIIDTLPEGPEKETALAYLDKTETALGKVQDFLAKAVPAVTQANAEIQKATNWLDAAESAAKAGAGFAPMPWSAILGLGIPLIFAIIRAARNKQAAINIAKSVQPLVSDALAAKPQLADQLSATQGHSGKAIVDQAQGDWGLPL